MAYYGHELATVVEYLRVSLSVLRIEAARRWPAPSPREWLVESIRAADRILVHDVDVRTLAGAIEQT
jgi:hypothetical protein